ncbi:Hypothetical predicted protein [Marmota monax]|uniref:Tyrosine-protein phosphatase domain-containing protein n=1 Tax=Marmota monax TaxID=9995 RepID=A0A5E4C6U6_MARMO|nr:hypothetical protein GHT09_011515 [Marmota monax]VTJ77544.1 Hypothetical predicted protein [Marmota monax]
MGGLAGSHIPQNAWRDQSSGGQTLPHGNRCLAARVTEPHLGLPFCPQMVWESGCAVIVMLTPLTENGVRQSHHYWPDEGANLYHFYEVPRQGCLRPQGGACAPLLATQAGPPSTESTATVPRTEGLLAWARGFPVSVQVISEQREASGQAKAELQQLSCCKTPLRPNGSVNLVSEHIWCEDFLVRSFYLKNLQTRQTRTVTQFHFLSWYDGGVPSSTGALLDFRRSRVWVAPAVGILWGKRWGTCRCPPALVLVSGEADTLTWWEGGPWFSRQPQREDVRPVWRAGPSPGGWGEAS